MNIHASFKTSRLFIEPLTLSDSNFIFELVNSENWIKFIGNRNITSNADAVNYIQKVIDNPNTVYWVVNLKDSSTAIGIITFIKRDYLEHHDIGFAFLEDFFKNGYAYEATNAVLNYVVRNYNLTHILATTISENISSIRLLEKLGLYFEKEIESNGKNLFIYGTSTDKLSINEIIKSFFEVFTNTNSIHPKLNLLHSLCVPEIIFINKKDTTHDVYNLHSFIQPRQKQLTDGTLREFIEYETLEQTIISNNVAQRKSEYQKTGILEGKNFNQKGHKFFQFLKTINGWKISSVIWEDEKN